MKRRTRAAFCGLLALVLAPALAGVQAAPKPGASPSPAPNGYVGTGDVVVTTAFTGFPLTIGGTIAIEERGQDLRLDLVSVASPQTPGGVPTALNGAALIPPGGVVVVFDRKRGTVTSWLPGKKMYFVSAGRPKPSASPAVASSPSPAPTALSPANVMADAVLGGNDLFGAFGNLKVLRAQKSFSLSISMNGHATLFDHPVSDVTYQLTDVDLTSTKSYDLHGEIAFADDLDEVPIRLTMNFSAATGPGGSVRIDLTSLEKRNVDPADFSPPADYVRGDAPDLGGFLKH